MITRFLPSFLIDFVGNKIECLQLIFLYINSKREGQTRFDTTLSECHHVLLIGFKLGINFGLKKY